MIFKFIDITFSIGTERELKNPLSGLVNPGEVLVVRGPSGSGKSTLLRVLSRLQTGSGGEAFLEDKSWSGIPGPVWRADVHYLAQKTALFDGTVAENLAKPFETRLTGGRRAFDPSGARELMEKLLLDNAMWDRDVRTLSGGEASRLAFVRSLAVDPRVLLLDEPTAALDERSREAFYLVLSRWVGQNGRAVLLVSHTEDYKQLSNSIRFLDIETRGGI
ncbi:MAG: ABC transporter [Peptococcaceae bacterium BRH_c4a]|nr:MAG: ABC transporter [Peptococcaceae bacterium BRH_c4a]